VKLSALATILLAGLSLFPAAAPALALDFTAQETWRQLEGVRIPILMFSDPTGRIRYQPPGGWDYSGGGPTFALYPAKTNGAFMKFFVLGHATGIPEIAAFSSDDLEKWCHNYLATDATEVQLVVENPSPFMLSGKPSREFIFEYKSAGQRFKTSVAVLDWNEREHLAVVITALGADFNVVHDAGTSSLFSWSLRKAEPARPAMTPEATGATASASPSGSTPVKAAGQ